MKQKTENVVITAQAKQRLSAATEMHDSYQNGPFSPKAGATPHRIGGKQVMGITQV